MSYSNKTHVVLLKDKNDVWDVRTKDVCIIKEDKPSNTSLVYFKNKCDDKEKGPLYQYANDRVVVLKNLEILNPLEYKVYYKEELQTNVYVICHFNNPSFNYWTILKAITEQIIIPQ